jgi:hypothetical protein
VLQQQAEELVRRHTESPLVICHECQHVTLRWHKGSRILKHIAGRELHRRNEPMAHEVLQVHLRDLGRGLVLFHHGSRGKEKQHFLSPKNLPFLYFSLSLPLSLFRGREGERGGND